MDGKSENVLVVPANALESYIEGQDMQFLAHLYEITQYCPVKVEGAEEDATTVIEAALNRVVDDLEKQAKSVTNRRVYAVRDGEIKNVIYDTVLKYGVPESTQVKSIEILTKAYDNESAIANIMVQPHLSEKARKMCEDYITYKIMHSPDPMNIEDISNLRGMSISERMKKICEAAMIHDIKKHGKNGATHDIRKFIMERNWISDEVKNIAIKELGQWEAISKEEFLEALRVMSDLGELLRLNKAFGQANSDRMREHIENAMIDAMENASKYERIRGNLYKSREPLGGKHAIEEVIDLSCSYKVKEKAREIIGRNYKWDDVPPKRLREISRKRDKLIGAERKIDAYIRQERERIAEGGMLSEGTVSKPKNSKGKKGKKKKGLLN